jgi:cyanophycinase
MMGDHEEGFGLISNIAIDQHLLKRNRQFDIFNILDNRPELLGIGLDENTGILVQENQFEVIGESYVAIYDGKMWSDDTQAYRDLPKGSREFYFLNPGMKYHMKKREKILKK